VAGHRWLPQYDTSKITTPVGLFVGGCDTLIDVDRQLQLLPPYSAPVPMPGNAATAIASAVGLASSASSNAGSPMEHGTGGTTSGGGRRRGSSVVTSSSVAGDIISSVPHEAGRGGAGADVTSIAGGSAAGGESVISSAMMSPFASPARESGARSATATGTLTHPSGLRTPVGHRLDEMGLVHRFDFHNATVSNHAHSHSHTQHPPLHPPAAAASAAAAVSRGTGTPERHAGVPFSSRVAHGGTGTTVAGGAGPSSASPDGETAEASSSTVPSAHEMLLAQRGIVSRTASATQLEPLADDEEEAPASSAFPRSASVDHLAQSSHARPSTSAGQQQQRHRPSAGSFSSPRPQGGTGRLRELETVQEAAHSVGLGSSSLQATVLSQTTNSNFFVLERQPVFIFEEPAYEHLDFMWGATAKVRAFPAVVALLNRFRHTQQRVRPPYQPTSQANATAPALHPSAGAPSFGLMSPFPAQPQVLATAPGDTLPQARGQHARRRLLQGT
jgi:hypothetical protein